MKRGIQYWGGLYFLIYCQPMVSYPFSFRHFSTKRRNKGSGSPESMVFRVMVAAPAPAAPIPAARPTLCPRPPLWQHLRRLLRWHRPRCLWRSFPLYFSRHRMSLQGAYTHQYRPEPFRFQRSSDGNSDIKPGAAGHIRKKII